MQRLPLNQIRSPGRASRTRAAESSFFSGKKRASAIPASRAASTISRATRDKYLQCRQGTYPLRYFFSRAVGEQGLSRQAVKQRLLALVQNEDPRRPLSDQRLCELLAEDGIRVARRTVAKYRMELRLPSSSARRR